MKVDKLWMDGAIVDGASATTHVLTHALHYGSGVFEGIRCYETPEGPAIFRLPEHVERLRYSASAIGMEIPYDAAQLAEACRQAVRANGLRSAYLRPLAFYGHDTLGVPPRQCPVVTVVAAWSWGAYVAAESPKIQVSGVLRIHPRSLDCRAKVTGHYVNSLMAVRKAHDAGFDEAMLLDHEGYVAECSGENVFGVKEGKVFTPPEGSILPGITRASVMEILRAEGVEVEERRFRVEELKGADEAFMTGTAAEVTPISQLDDVVLTEGAGPLTARLRDLYQEVVHRRDPRFEAWCHLVDPA